MNIKEFYLIHSFKHDQKISPFPLDLITTPRRKDRVYRRNIHVEILLLNQLTLFLEIRRYLKAYEKSKDMSSHPSRDINPKQ